MLIDESLPRPLTLDEFGTSLVSLARFDSPPFLAVAVSGGPDSLALALLADRWTRARGGEICALTVDHRLRPESGAEIHRLAAWLSTRRIRHEVLVWSGKKPESGIQEAARIARYRLLAGWCREHGCLHLLTAHHRDDQIETHLMRRRARSGADGLAGMSAIRELADCRVLRPLLGVAKDRLCAFLQAERQPFITDPSNLDPAFERSRFRGREGAPGVKWAASDLLEDIRKLGSLRTANERAANVLLARHVSVHPAGFALLDPGILSIPSHEMMERLLSAVAATIGGTSYPPRRARIGRLRDVLSAATTRGHVLGGCRFIRWRGHVLVVRELARAASPIRLTPGATSVWDCRFKIMAPAGSGPCTIGHLGLTGVVHLNRRAQEKRARLPRLVLPILPAVWDEDGLAAVPHLGYRREGVGALPQVVFSPVNPLTQAGFAVV